ncbi:MAG: hypothetical protein R2800_13310 [Flavipsychrobacter sp.]
MSFFFRTSKLTIAFCACVLVMCSNRLLAQSLAQRKAAQRYEIEAKRIGSDINSEDALPRSREFKRIDSTYYVGWMYEGVYKYNHAADYLGYKNASVPLERALAVMERDYRKELATRTSDLMTYYPVYRFHLDYTMIALYLKNCYENMEQPKETYALLRRVLKWRFQRDYYMDAYNYLGWIVHRNRYYTNEKYPFLKNSIDANEALANKYLDSGLRRIQKDKWVNRQIFQPGYEKQERMSVYHYKSILHSYALNIDSAAYYYNKMKGSGIFPHNNYATFRTICGDFREAESEYKKAVAQDAGDKRLKEWAYYRSILSIYKGEQNSGIELIKDMIRANGSTPGFGWYNIALGRLMYYDGQYKEAERYTNKAAEFKELHIGTTLGQSHYDFSVQMLKLMNKQAEIERLKFENSNWWYNPSVLLTMAGLKAELYTQQFLIINQFAKNPERDRVVYKLFSTESTISWDEVWYLIKDFSTDFFLKKFNEEAQSDDRRYIRKYFKLFVAKLQIEKGNYTKAQTILDEILQDSNIDEEYEQLFLARVFEAAATCAKEKEDVARYQLWMDKMYQFYPELIPTSGLKMSMNLHLAGDVDEKLIQRLRDCNIDWKENEKGIPQVYLSFSKTKDKYKVIYTTKGADGNIVVQEDTISYQKPEEGALELSYKLFDIGNTPKKEDVET